MGGGNKTLAIVNTPDPSFLGPACCLNIKLQAQPHQLFSSSAPEPAEDKPVAPLAILLSYSETLDPASHL